ncbi:porin family protein [Flavobacterium psychrotolerans]|uniref:Outer membrane protein beta-barrel domain-containing protein n=1 Tax=Flavobacterium psychrotolerans TaxID=2169410 RepID=A0A2U1JNJ7_9FLAO|nr:porin family protein [Flavobacterium psychrotolerans]PWA06544.1 hypothetical protein DB895_03770 [Flavobacterium psychrotolerans]
MKFFLNVFLFFTVLNSIAQSTRDLSPIIAVDSLYREDQFYLTFTYNSLLNRPSGISQSKFSSGFAGGFLRDIPINNDRTLAIAPGFGLSYNKYFQDLLVSRTNQTNEYSAVPSDKSFRKNKLDQFYVDVPIEIRWRTSTPESHKFWRIYSGFKFSYIIWNKYTHVDAESDYKINLASDFNKLQMGTYLTLGYNTWNFYAYYGLTPLFKSSAKINKESVGFNTLNLGLMFYIL